MWCVKYFSVIFFYLVVSVHSKRHDVHEMMYQTYDDAPACFRRLNGTHQFGCSSPRGGSYGVIHFIRNETDLRDFLRNGVAGPYAIVLSPLLFRRNIVDSLVSSSKVSGIVLNIALTPDIEPIPSSYSPDDVCPNRYSVTKNTCDIAWNPASNNFLLHDWPLPVFLVNQLDQYTAIANCHDKFNPPLDESQLSRPLCSLHLKSHMHAAVDSETCLRRINYYGVKPTKYCDPVGDQNVVLPSLPWQENDTKNVIIVGARMDALSLFDGIAPGAMSTVTGLVTLVTSAYIFHKMVAQNDSKPNNDIGVMFALFNGEAYDFIGSSRVVYDMHQGLFPSINNKMDMNNIRLFIELFQLSSSRKVYVHHTNDKDVTDFLNYLNITSSFDVNFLDSNIKEFPPASFQSFYKANNNISGAILSNFRDSFANTYFNSIYDTAKYLDYVYANGSISEKSPDYSLQYRLADIALILASYLYKKAYNNKEPPPLPQANKSVELVDELLHCYIETRKCRLMNEVGAGASNKVPDLLPMYVGVKNPENYLARVTGFILAYLTGKKIPITRENCVNDETQKDYSLFWMNGESGTGECINSSVLLTPAESPAFYIDNYDWKSGLYSTWTESVWTKTTLGLFIKPFRIQEIIVLSTGLLVLILSFTTVYFFNKKSDLIFMSTTPTSC